MISQANFQNVSLALFLWSAALDKEINVIINPQKAMD